MANVLIVDDDIALSGMVRDWLSHEAYQVKLVHTGSEGWDLIQTNEFDLVVLDWDLPDLSGVEILKKFRDGGGVTPVILLTGHTGVDDKEFGLDAGANDYLTKPFHLKELSARIRNMLRAQAATAPQSKPLGANNEQVLARVGLNGSALAAKYEFLDVIGEGAFGVVLKARHPHLDKLVAIKMLSTAKLSEEAIVVFQHEGRVVSRLDHPNIVILHDFGFTERRHPFMVMEFVPGTDLLAVLEEQNFLPLDRALEIMIRVCDGLAHAHSMGVLHRDIKTSNIMLKEMPDRAAVPKILDFGLALLKEANLQASHLPGAHGEAVGSPPYMSPEQVRGEQLDERSDIYSFGCVLFEIATGFVPHVADDPVDIMRKHLEEPPLTFREARPEIGYPPELQTLVERTLAKRPEERYQTMRELRNDLEQIRDLVAISFRK